jgi:ferrous iron transport protein B
VTGLVAKEVVVATFTTIGSIATITFSQVTAYAFMIFTLLAAPCFAAIGTMKREFGNWKWTLYAMLYQTGVAYVLATLVNLIGSAIFVNSPVTTQTALDAGILEEVSEGNVVNGDVVLIAFGIILVAAVIVILVNKASQHKKYGSLKGTGV